MNILIHPGFHKTATTWLQKTLFRDGNFFHAPLGHEDINRIFVSPHDSEWDSKIAKDEFLAIASKTPRKLPIILSSELLVGNPFTGARDSIVILNRLKKSLPNAKILLTIRRQEDILVSLFKQYIKRGGTLKYTEFLSLTTEPGYEWFNLQTLEFHRLAERYASEFGRENIKIMPYEILCRSQYDFVKMILDFSGLVVNENLESVVQSGRIGESQSDRGLGLMRISNHFRGGVLNQNNIKPLHRLGDLIYKFAWLMGNYTSDNNQIKNIIHKSISDRFSISNRKLQYYCEDDLKKLGYQME